MTTYNRVAGNLVFQTTGGADTITFTGLTANTTTVVIDGDLSVSGNASLTGNIAGDKIFNGTSSIEIPAASGNIVMSVAGVPNVVVVTSTGVSFAGDIAFSGNVTAGNLLTGGVMSAAGNVTGANINTGGTNGLTLNGANINANAGRITINSDDSDVDFAIDGDTLANVFYVDAGTGTASFGSSTQTTNAVVAFNASN